MKRINALIFCILIGHFAMAQKVDITAVPQPVKKTYYSKIADSLTAKWTRYEGFYEARFIKNDNDASIQIDEKGDWLRTQWEIPDQYLSRKVKEYATKNYSGYKIVSAIIEFKPGGEFYLVHVKKGGDSKVLRFSIKSEFIAVDPVPVYKKPEKPPKEKKTGED